MLSEGHFMSLEMDFENGIDHDAGTEPMREQQRGDATTTGCNTCSSCSSDHRSSQAGERHLRCATTV